MITYSILHLFLIFTNYSTHNVKVGKRYTAPTVDGSFEKSFVWIIDKPTVKTFDKKINKENCLKIPKNSIIFLLI